jgi:diaminohydroxyphosphoribosylaminopyrimidine deaminase/5-amino-6-(5-phosphoribosylamino)uracil reductase
MTEAEAMQRALDLAWAGWGRVHPNPLVGAVLLQDGQVVGEGWHGAFGEAHAEVAALRVAGPAASGSTMVVTLEPCRHHGKQPPCTDAILAAGVRRVVYGLPDPNPSAGGGAAQLAGRGLQVAHLPHPGIEDQNAPFLHRFGGARRPFIALKLATTVDGRVADYTGRARWISGPAARDWVHWLRAGFDAIAVGGRTARADDPSLTVRGSVVPRVPPRRVVFDRRADLEGARQLLGTARQVPLTVVCESAAPGVRGELEDAGAEVLIAGGLEEGMARLHDAGIGSVLVEGGGRLAGRLMQAGLMDRFYWVQSPLWLGDDGPPAFAGLRGELLEQARRWRVVERKSLGDDTLLVLARQ